MSCMGADGVATPPTSRVKEVEKEWNGIANTL